MYYPQDWKFKGDWIYKQDYIHFCLFTFKTIVFQNLILHEARCYAILQESLIKLNSYN